MKAALRVMALCVGACCISPVLAFTDPLDKPAMLSPLAASAPLYGIASDGKSTLITVGPRGHILHSEDAGKHFTQSAAPLSSDLVAVYFVNQSKGWAVGHDGVILHSADGGTTWERQLDGRQIGELAERYYRSQDQHSDDIARAMEYAQTLKEIGAVRPLLDVYFENENEGWVIGAYNLILHTVDGGENWVPWMDRSENPDEYSLHAIRRIGDQIFIVGELGLLLRLDPEQQRFVQQESPYPGSFFGLTGREGLIVIFGLRGNAFTSTDDGNTWRKLDTQTSNSLNAGVMLPDGSFMLASAGGELLVSNEAGDRIVRELATQRMPIYGLATASSGVVAIGPQGAKVLPY